MDRCGEKAYGDLALNLMEPTGGEPAHPSL